jgi:hypothetical protein
LFTVLAESAIARENATMNPRNTRWMLALALSTVASVPAAAAGVPAPGDVYVYRLVNGYNREARGEQRHEVTRVDAASVTVAVTPDNPEAGYSRTERHARDGNGLRHPLENHGQKVDYEFTSPYPAYVFPLEAGKEWSLRVKASVPGEPRLRSVRVDGRVLGTERVRVPAGEFDAVRIRRYVYPGDTDFMLTETRISEIEWYAPALGRAVRIERRSQYMDLRLCHEDTACEHHGDWDIFELVSGPAQKR